MANLLEIGHDIRGYEIKDRMTQGMFANTYKAWDGDAGRDVFFKQYCDPTEFCIEIFPRFCEQQRYLMKTLNPIGQAETIYDVFEHDGIHFQAKEFMDGEDLASFLVSSSLPISQRATIALAMLSAMSKIHKAGIVHTDMKPQQIFLRKGGGLLGYQVKICDFDFCRIPGQYEPAYVVGTAFYKSPEHEAGLPLEFASDVFTLGVILYEILTGADPYDVEDEEGYWAKVRAQDAPRPQGRVAEIPVEVSDMVFRSLSPQAPVRPSVDELEDIFTKWIKGEIGGSEEEPSVVYGPPPVATTAIRVHLKPEDGDLWLPIHEDTTVGRRLLRITPKAQFVSGEQFDIGKKGDAWVVRGKAGVTNPTYLNGEDVAGQEVELKSGDVVFVGNISTGNGLNLHVELIYV